MQQAGELARWEKAEIERSANEASGTDPDGLCVSDFNISRYMNPPADTPFPLEYAYHLLCDIRAKVVLDFGCGNGENTLLLVKRGAKVISMDLSQSLIELAKRRLELNGVSGDVTFLVASAHNLPLRSNSVDIVFGMAILHHLDLALAAPEVRRVLRKNGKAIFQEPVRNSRMLRAIRKLIPYRHPDVSPFERPLTDQELADFARGFAGSSDKAFLLPYVRLAQHLPIDRKRVRDLYHLDARVLRRFPSLNHYAAIKVMELVK